MLLSREVGLLVVPLFLAGLLAAPPSRTGILANPPSRASVEIRVAPSAVSFCLWGEPSDSSRTITQTGGNRPRSCRQPGKVPHTGAAACWSCRKTPESPGLRHLECYDVNGADTGPGFTGSGSSMSKYGGWLVLLVNVQEECVSLCVGSHAGHQNGCFSDRTSLMSSSLVVERRIR